MEKKTDFLTQMEKIILLNKRKTIHINKKKNAGTILLSTSICIFIIPLKFKCCEQTSYNTFMHKPN